MLATYSDDLSGPDTLQHLDNQRQERPQIVDVVAWRDHDHDADAQPGHVLLELKTLIDRQQDFE
jgi:hypothetical protein